MKYAFNGRFLTKKLTGQERFATELLFQLDKLAKKGEYCVVTSTNPVWLPQYKNIEIIQIGKLKREAWEQFCLGPFLKKNHLKCVNLTSTFAFGHCEVVCLHDASVFEIGGQYMHSIYGFLGTIWKRLLCRIAARKSEKIITVSEYSKNKLSEILSIPESKTTVIYNAWQHYSRVETDDSIQQRLPDNIKKGEYFFAMSSLSPQKNFIWIKEVAKRNPNSMFVITGKSEGFTHLGIDDLKTNNLYFTGYLSDGEIKWLMQNCRAFIHPAIYEGFGIPPLEAMSCGAEIIVSTATCLPEIYQNSVHYIDPYDYEVDLDALLRQPIESREKVLERFDWQKEAEKLYKLLTE